MNEVLRSAITVIVVDAGDGAVDGQLLKVGSTMTVELGIEVGEDATLEQRVFGEVDTANNMTRLELPRVRIDFGACASEDHTMICSVSAK